MWHSASELTLQLCADLLKEGWLLKDATPLNVLFQGSKPVFVDVLSVARADLRIPIWYAYGQFVRTFLLPLLAYVDLGWPLQAAMIRRDGYEPEDLAAVLSWSTRLRQPALSAITIPLFFSKHTRYKEAESQPRTVGADAGRYILGKTLSRLRKHMLQLRPRTRKSTWSGYTGGLGHYTVRDITDKEQFVRQALISSAAQSVLDVGCNAGVYSRIAAENGARVVAIDTDLQTIEQLFRDLQRSELAGKILPLCIDLARPTPALGWENRESASFLSRCQGQFDFVLMLAVVHHLLLGSQIPLEHLANLCSRLTTSDLLIEWVPPTDVKYREILRGRESIYRHISEGAFRIAFGNHFSILHECNLSNGRVILHMRLKDI